MSGELKYTCCCGATFSMELNTYIHRGGCPDCKGRVFIAELRGAEWLDRHQSCLRIHQQNFSPVDKEATPND